MHEASPPQISETRSATNPDCRRYRCLLPSPTPLVHNRQYLSKSRPYFSQGRPFLPSPSSGLETVEHVGLPAPAQLCARVPCPFLSPPRPHQSVCTLISLVYRQANRFFSFLHAIPVACLPRTRQTRSSARTIRGLEPPNKKGDPDG